MKLVVLLALLVLSCGPSSGNYEEAVIVDTYLDASGNYCFYLESRYTNSDAPTGVYCKE